MLNLVNKYVRRGQKGQQMSKSSSSTNSPRSDCAPSPTSCQPYDLKKRKLPLWCVQVQIFLLTKAMRRDNINTNFLLFLFSEVLCILLPFFGTFGSRTSNTAKYQQNMKFRGKGSEVEKSRCAVKVLRPFNA